MRKLTIAALLLTFIAIACSKDDTTTAVDTGTTATDTATTTAATDTSGDLTFATDASNANLAEIQMGQLAVSKATNPDVQAYGQMMVTDHTAIGKTYSFIAKAQGLPMPTQLNPQFQQEYDDLAKLSGAAFNQAYVAHAVHDHEGAVQLFTTEADGGQDPRLKAFAMTWLPVIQEHLNAAKELQGKLPK